MGQQGQQGRDPYGQALQAYRQAGGGAAASGRGTPPLMQPGQGPGQQAAEVRHVTPTRREE